MQLCNQFPPFLTEHELHPCGKARADGAAGECWARQWAALARRSPVPGRAGAGPAMRHDQRVVVCCCSSARLGAATSALRRRWPSFRSCRPAWHWRREAASGAEPVVWAAAPAPQNPPQPPVPRRSRWSKPPGRARRIASQGRRTRPRDRQQGALADRTAQRAPPCARLPRPIQLGARRVLTASVRTPRSRTAPRCRSCCSRR
jgi:hypothetical protein